MCSVVAYDQLRTIEIYLKRPLQKKVLSVTLKEIVLGIMPLILCAMS